MMMVMPPAMRAARGAMPFRALAIDRCSVNGSVFRAGISTKVVYSVDPNQKMPARMWIHSAMNGPHGIEANVVSMQISSRADGTDLVLRPEAILRMGWN